MEDKNSSLYYALLFSKLGGGGGSTSGGIVLVGETTTALTDNATTNPITVNGQSYTAQPNDAVIYGNKEFLFDGTKWHEFGDLSGLNADMIDDTSTTKKFTNATEKTKLGRIKMDSTETQDYYFQNSTPSNARVGDFWFNDEALVSSDVTAMTGYSKAQSASAIATSDTLNEAVGKLEYKVDLKQNEVLGSWTAGTATSHSTPATTDTVLQAMQKIDNNQRLDETNISSLYDHITFSANSKMYYLQPEQPSNPSDGDIWIG